MVLNKKWHPLNLINFSCSWPGKGAPANWEQFLNCTLVRLRWSVQGKALIFFPCTWALWKSPCVKLISTILHESRVWGEALAAVSQPGPSDRPMQHVQRRWQCGSSAGSTPKGKIHQFWSLLTTPTRQNGVKREHSFLCRSMSPFHGWLDTLLALVSSVWEPARQGRSLLGRSCQMTALNVSSFGAPSSSKISWVPLPLCIAKGSCGEGNILNS